MVVYLAHSTCASIPITGAAYIEEVFLKGKPIGKYDMFGCYCYGEYFC
jgi:hypothetical protein